MNPDSRQSGSGRLFRRLRHEPLFHFLGAAALLFVANALFSGDDRELVSVDYATQVYLVQQQQDLVLRELTDEEKDEVIRNFVEEEILVREARKRGFENSSRIRALLIQNMRFFMAGDIPEPTEADLRQFFEENIELFESPSTVTYDHVLFRNPEEATADALAALRDGAAHETMGDTNPMNAKIYSASEQTIVATFGREEAPTILAIDDTLWHGPFSSDSGAHFLRVAKRAPPRRPTWEQAQNWIGTEWLRMKNREIVDRELAQMKANYRIEIETPATGDE